MIEAQSRKGGPNRRKQILRAMERKLAKGNARPMIFYHPSGTWQQPSVKGTDNHGQKHFRGWRTEDVWLDK